jgi:hypothetical protein
MASTYDKAKIISGDPMGRAKEGAREADSLFARYMHEKDIIETINKAIEDAREKSSKDKGITGFLSSLASLGMNFALPPGVGKIGSSIIAGLIPAAAEKIRQDKIDPTEKLREIEKQLKGRRQLKDVERTKDVFEDQLDSMVSTDFLSNAVMNYLIPVSGAETAGVQGARNINEIVPWAPAKPSLSMTPGAGQDVADILGLEGVFKEGLKGLFELDFMKEPLMLALTRLAGPQVAGQYLYPKTVVDPYSQPQFRNPYRGGY